MTSVRNIGIVQMLTSTAEWYFQAFFVENSLIKRRIWIVSFDNASPSNAF
jgi:hypothetical protein